MTALCLTCSNDRRRITRQQLIEARGKDSRRRVAALIDRLIGKGKLIAIDGDQIAERQLSEDELIAASRDLLSAAPLPDWTIGEYGQLEVGAHLRRAVAHLRDAAAVIAETTGASAEASAFGGSSPQ